MTTAIDVAEYIESKAPPYGEMQLQKLVYYVQAWSLAWDGRPMFSEPIEAWQQGPVIRTLRRWRDWRRRISADDSPLTDQERATVDAVLAFYRRWSGGELADRTHEERPWREVWEARRPQGSSRCSDPISLDAMRSFYTELALLHSDQVPKRESTSVVEAPEDEVRKIAAANAERWRGTLAILAQ